MKGVKLFGMVSARLNLRAYGKDVGGLRLEVEWEASVMRSRDDVKPELIIHSIQNTHCSGHVQPDDIHANATATAWAGLL